MTGRQTKTIQWTINFPMDFPSDWDDDMIEFHLNESSWCCSNLISELEKYDNGECLLGWNRLGYETTRYTNLTEYLCDCVGASTGKNVCACCVDLAKYNDMTMAKLFEKYGE